MARKKRTSQVLAIARQRLAGLKKITPAPDLGSKLNVEIYEAEVNGFTTEHDLYNGELAGLDEKTNHLDERERKLADLNQQILAAIKGQYGPDSSEFEQVGGKRRSDRKKRARGNPQTPQTAKAA